MPEFNVPMQNKTKGRGHKGALIAVALLVALFAAVAALVFLFLKGDIKIPGPVAEIVSRAGVTEEAVTEDPEILLARKREEVLARARRTAEMYDYDAAIEDVKSNFPDYSEQSDLAAFVTECEQKKAGLVMWNEGDNSNVTHIFFHSLIVDNEKAFSSYKSEGYNQVMTTIPEFRSILDQMYGRGFVLVSLHDVAEIRERPDGTKAMTFNPIYLPEGKIPFVLSQDDVNYYEYMKETGGFANRIVVGEDGRPTCEMDLDDGTSVRGEYDVVPIVDAFVEEHPDFSYHGAKGIIALTGYNGILGYRTSEIAYGAGDPDWADAHIYRNPNIDADREEAKRVAEALKADGWTFASHSWGHMDMGEAWGSDGSPTRRFYRDTDWWENEVGSLIGPCDTIIFAFGADIGSWQGYTDSNQMYTYLKDKGFDYFCNVDSSKHAWVQISDSTYGGGYLRQGRRNLDGMMLFKDALYPEKEVFSDLIEPGSVFDKDRPLPVTGIPLPDGFDADTWDAKEWADAHRP